MEWVLFSDRELTSGSNGVGGVVLRQRTNKR